MEPPLKSYLLSVQPGYDDKQPATQSYYNRGWIIGGVNAIGAQTHARIDSLLETIRQDSVSSLGDSGTPGAAGAPAP